MTSQEWPESRLKYEISVLEDLLHAIDLEGEDSQLRWAKREVVVYLNELRGRLVALRLSA